MRLHAAAEFFVESWFVAKAAVALIPIVIFLTADVIEWFLRRKRRVPAERVRFVEN